MKSNDDYIITSCTNCGGRHWRSDPCAALAPERPVKHLHEPIVTAEIFAKHTQKPVEACPRCAVPEAELAELRLYRAKMSLRKQKANQRYRENLKSPFR